MASNCTRCGKPRVMALTWTEQVGNSTLTRSEYVCSDSDCQKIVQRELDNELHKRQNVEREKKQREQERLVLKRNTS